MARTTFTILAVLVAILGGVYQLHFKSWLKILGLGHVIREGEYIHRDCHRSELELNLLGSWK